mgnify:CR=1 FL=1
MATEQFDAQEVVRIRMQTPEGERWSRRLPRYVAERHVAMGPDQLAIEHTKGLLVKSAAIVRWTYN